MSIVAKQFREAALEAAAEAWSGTPFCEQSNKKGIGVCCHAAVLEVYFDALWLPRFEYPLGPMRSGVRLLRAFMETDTHFERVEGNPMVGDTLFFAGSHVGHFALQLSDGRVFHCERNAVAGIATHIQPVWQKRLSGIYRPRMAL